VRWDMFLCFFSSLVYIPRVCWFLCSRFPTMKASRIESCIWNLFTIFSKKICRIKTCHHPYVLLWYPESSRFHQCLLLRIFQRFTLVKFIKKIKTRVKNLKIEKIIAFDKYEHEPFIAFYFHLSKHLFLTLKNNEVVDLANFSTKYGCFKSF